MEYLTKWIPAKEPPGDMTAFDLAPTAAPWMLACAGGILLWYCLIAVEWQRARRSVPDNNYSCTMSLLFWALVANGIAGPIYRLTTAFYLNVWLLVAILAPMNVLLCVVWLRLKRLKFFRIAYVGSYIAERPAAIVSSLDAYCPSCERDPVLTALAEQIRELSQGIRAQAAGR